MLVLPAMYCKRGNIRGTLIFADFAVFVRTFWTRRSCVLTMCVDANG